jgi:hypothetical protein
VRPPICLDAEVRPVPGWPGLSVSAAGAIYGPKGLRKVQPGTNGYSYIAVRRPGRPLPAKLRIHHAVLLAWVGPRPEGHEGRHLNGDHDDNRADNLAWSTHLANIADKEAHGTMLRGAAAGRAKLSEGDVRAMRAAWPGESYAALGRRFGVSKSTAHAAVSGRRWGHLTNENEGA